MKLLVIDFETFYSKTFSLSKMTTEEYIRHEEFEVIGFAIKEDDNETVWYTGNDETIRAALARYDFANSFVVGHNMRFDAAILSWHYDIHPRGIGDTMGMAQLLHGLDHSVSLKSVSEIYGVGEKGTEVLDALGKHRTDFMQRDLERYGAYCINDVELTYKIFNLMLKRFTKTELKLIDLTIRMFTEPKLVLNKGLLVQHLMQVRANKEKLLNEANVDKYALLSNPKFAELLRSHGVEPPMKKSPATGNDTYAFAKTDEAFKELLNHENPAIQVLAAARIGNKSTLEETRTEQFINIANRGLLPVPLKYCGATVSHRWSGVDGINLQNLPRTSPLRRAICAPAGHKIVASDLSNIELRLAYWFASSANNVEAIRQGVDLYKKSASEIASVPYDEVTKDLRYIFKVVNLSGIYGVGAAKMHSILTQGGVQRDLRDVQNIVYAFRNSNKELTEAWSTAGEMLDAVFRNQAFEMGPNGIIKAVEGGLLKPNGMVLGLPNLRKLKGPDGTGEAWAYDKIMGKNVIPEYTHAAKTFQRCIQSLARDIIAEQLVQVAKRYPVVCTIHDELIMLCKESEVDDCVAYVTQCMTTAPEWCADLPLACEVGVGDNYMDAK